MQVHRMLPKYIRSHLRRLGKEEQGESGPTRLLILETKKKWGPLVAGQRFQKPAGIRITLGWQPLIFYLPDSYYGSGQAEPAASLRHCSLC